jgi:hypothetical protein
VEIGRMQDWKYKKPDKEKEYLNVTYDRNLIIYTIKFVPLIIENLKLDKRLKYGGLKPLINLPHQRKDT